MKPNNLPMSWLLAVITIILISECIDLIPAYRIFGIIAPGPVPTVLSYM